MDKDSSKQTPGGIHQGAGPAAAEESLSEALNGLEQVDSGHIIFDDVEITDSKTNMNNVRREVGMVFQQFNLF